MVSVSASIWCLILDRSIVVLQFLCSTRCVNNRCIEYNEKRNIFNAGRHFVTFLLPHGAPARFQPIIDKVIDGYNTLTMTSKQLLTSVTKIVDLYKLGRHLNRTTQEQIKTGKEKRKKCPQYQKLE